MQVPMTRSEKGADQGQVRVDIPARMEGISQYSQVVVKAVTIDPKVVQTDQRPPESNKEIASNIVMINIDGQLS